ncbi:unnamed protein product [Tilletia controversa]|nr:unnamed protein product [Tilletia controversa]CAD6985535.1 unnamed protein product [Tilletia controversa]
MKNTAPRKSAEGSGANGASASTTRSAPPPGASAAKKRKSFDSSAASTQPAAASSSANKKAKTGEREKPAASKSTFSGAGTGAGAGARPASSSVLLSSAETDFPRGGGSVLTPLEHRQALREARAEADALFKDSTTPANKSTAPKSSGGAGDAVVDAERNKAGLAKQKYNRDKQNALKKKHALPGDAAPQGQSGAAKKDFLRIERINYKRLQTGARLLCTILAIHPFALVLSLPGQLLGHVPITAISPSFTERLQSMADAAEDDDDEEDEGSDEDESDDDNDGQDKRRGSKRSSDAPELRDLFTVGQWVHASVTNVLSSGAYKAAMNESSNGQRSREGGEYERESRRVELSLDPTLFNQGVNIEELGPGFLLPAAVKSVEDHGYILDLGLESPLSAFCAFKDTPGGKKGPKLHVGQVVPANVLSIADNKRSATVTLKTKDITSAFLGSKSTPPSLSGLLPGLALDALITANLPAGLNVKLFGLFDATIDRAHLPTLKDGQEYETHFKEGKKIRARVFWELGDLYAEQLALGERDDDDGGPGARQYRKVALSAADHVLALEPPVVSVVGGINPSIPRKALSEAFPIGTKLRVTVTRVDEDWGLFCSLANNESQRILMGSDAASIQCFVHISSVSDSHIDTLSLVDSAPYCVGSKHEVRVISHAPTDRLILLSMKPSVLALKFMRVSEVVVGDEVRGTITNADEHKIVVDIGGAHNGIVFPSHFSDIQLKSKKALAKYKPGLSVKARVWAVNPAKNRIVLTLKKSLLQSDLPVVSSLKDARAGDITHAVVSRLPDPTRNQAGKGGAGGLLVDLYGGLRAFIPAKETSESSTSTEVVTAEDLNTRFFDGKVVKVRLTHIDYETGRLMASLRLTRPAPKTPAKTPAPSSAREPVINEAADLFVGSKYSGFVRAIADGGLTVDLGKNVQARVRVREAVDVLTSKWKDEFEVGKPVEGRIVSINKNGNKTVIDMTLRTPKEDLAKQRQQDKKDKSKKAAAANGKKAQLPFQHGLNEFKKGQKVKCFVKSIKEEIGLFLQIEKAGTNVSGLCHKSEVADNGSPEAVKAYSVGDRVKAIILKVHGEDKKVSFGLKPSYFDDADFVDSDDEEEEDETMAGADDDDDDEEDDDDDEEDEEADSEEEDETSLAQGDADSEDEDMNDVDNDDDEEAIDMRAVSTVNGGASVETVDPKKKKIAPLQLAGGFSWSGVGQDDETNGDGPGFDSDSSSEADDAEAKPKRAKGKGKDPAGAQKGAAADLDEKLPESVSDFERLLLGSPNNSFLWIQFMSFQLQLSDIEAARQVAQRALKVINYREEQEKLNVWIALLNLEDRFGSEDSLDTTFKEAVQANDAETVYVRMLTILEKSNKLAKAETIWTRAVKKFNTSVPVWTGFAKFYLRHGREDDVRSLMARAQQSLPKARHVELVKSFALAEFSTGEPERGRTLFERLVDSHPKKLDLWWLYIDQEAKAGNVPAARSIFERVLVLPQSLKKAKAVLKKWHAFEQKHGGPKDVQRVVKRAQQFVEATMRKREGAAGAVAQRDEGDEEEEEEEDEDGDDFADGDDGEEEEED